MENFGKYDEKYCELEALKGLPVRRVEISEEELVELLPEKFSVMDVIRYNLFLKRLSSEWESFEEFIEWWGNAALAIKHIRRSSEIFAERILREIEENKGKKILVVADYLTSKVLEEKLRERSLPYKFEDYLLSLGIDSTENDASQGGL